MSKKWDIVLILGLSLLIHFLFFGHPQETVFDEVHFGKFVSAYYTHEFYFDIHPPIGKHLIAGFGYLFGFRPEFAFGEIGDPFPNKQYLLLRFLPALAGSLLPLIIYLILLQLGVKRFLALAGGLLIIFDNSLLTQSRYILMDSFMLLFGFSSLLFYLYYRRSNNKKMLLLAGVFSGMALSVKWIALAFLGLPLLFEGWKYLEAFFTAGLKSVNWRDGFIKFLLLAMVPIFVYFIVFMVDFKLLYKSGTGDAFMSPSFQKTLENSSYQNNPEVKGSGPIKKFLELNFEMYKANQRLTATHPYSSQWFTWPFMFRPIYYWVKDGARIYFMGNPAVWWSSTIILLLVLITVLSNPKILIKDQILTLLLVGYFANMVPFMGVKRVMFLYHYLNALIFSIIILFYFLNNYKTTKKIAAVLVISAAVLFIFFAPLSYGLDLSSRAYEARVWFENWR